MDATSHTMPLPFLKNWLNHNASEPYLGAFEYPLHSDAQIDGQLVLQIGPYSFSRTMLRQSTPGAVQIPIVLRIAVHMVSNAPDFSRTNTTRYHGGELPDEIAALASLCMGVRLRAGAESRRFGVNDHFGHPAKWDNRSTPTLGAFGDKLVLPHVLQGTWAELSRLHSLPGLAHEQAIALVRAARLYQDALWIAESEPALAWLMFISALETAANHWKAQNGTASERFADSKPDLVAHLRQVGGDALVERVAHDIEHTLGATKKFVDFALTYLPAAPDPSIRPMAGGQVSWSRKSMKSVLSTVYAYRSTALHGGQPFPAPMCQAPFDFEGRFIELGSIGLSASSKGGVWQAADLPINLHAFHYVTRGVLLNWWDSMASSAATSA